MCVGVFDLKIINDIITGINVRISKCTTKPTGWTLKPCINVLFNNLMFDKYLINYSHFGIWIRAYARMTNSIAMKLWCALVYKTLHPLNYPCSGLIYLHKLMNNYTMSSNLFKRLFIQLQCINAGIYSMVYCMKK